MLKRTITGAVYIAVIVGFFFLRKIDTAFFQILIWLFGMVGTFEMVRALKDKLTLFQRVCVLAYGTLFVPVYFAFGFVQTGLAGVLYLTVLLIVVLLFGTVFDYKNSTPENTGTAILSAFYPNMLLLFALLINDFDARLNIALILIFVISPCADTFAYLIGSLLKGPKLCPNVSPKKTISGAIGGLVGGVLGALVLYFIMTPTLNVSLPILYIIFVGLVGSVFTMLGDLVESMIKRKVGIKDMGNILPGHGGILDRIDGILFASLFIYFAFFLI